MFIPRVALTPGEPAGIGPDQAIIAAQTEQCCELIVIANPVLLQDRAKQLGLTLKLNAFDATQPSTVSAKGELSIIPVDIATPVQCGKLDIKNSRYVLKTIHRATRGCLDGVFDAMVTAPAHKGVINDAGIEFSGHTEYIASICNAQPVMMLATTDLRVALATTHIALADVSQAITNHRLRNIIRILYQDLQTRFAIPKPKILVCGLNPHAGENGHLGREEIETIIPVLNGLRKQGIDLTGPLAADTIFTPKYLQHADVVLAMYHDQGLPVLKYKGFGNAVNISLGLPIIRTSVDHGTALDLAGTGNIETSSLQLAIKTAINMINNSHS